MAAGGGGGGVLPLEAAGGGGGTLDPLAGGFGAYLAGDFGAYFPADFGAYFVPLSPVFLSPVAGFLSPAFLSPALVSTGLVSAGVTACGAFYFPFLCLPESKTVSSGKIYVTTPAATVLPPYLNANLHPLVIVNGKCNLIFILRLSPGLAILTLSGK